MVSCKDLNLNGQWLNDNVIRQEQYVVIFPILNIDGLGCKSRLGLFIKTGHNPLLTVTNKSGYFFSITQY